MIFKRWTIFLLGSILWVASCSEDTGTGISSQRVADPYPLALGNHWEYTLDQQIRVVQEDSSVISLSSEGTQTVTVTRTESVTGDESFGLRHFHRMGQLLSARVDTSIEVHYLAPRGDKILFKAVQTEKLQILIPFSVQKGQTRYGARFPLGGARRFVPLSTLAHLLLEPAGVLAALAPESQTGPLLSSDGLQNREDVYFYNYDYIYVFKDLFKGKNWLSYEASSTGGIEESQKVTSMLSQLAGYEGPIAEVEKTIKFIDSYGSESYKIRLYYKSGVGIVQAEIYDNNFFIILETEDGYIPLGVGLWAVTKKLVSYGVN